MIAVSHGDDDLAGGHALPVGVEPGLDVFEAPADDEGSGAVT